MRVVSADSIFRIGKTHLVCQDYAAHYTSGEVAIAHLSDGCSTATSPHHADGSGQSGRLVYTDFGSRLLVLAAQRSTICALNKREHDPSIADTHSAVKEAVDHAKLLGLGSDAVSATLLGTRLEWSMLIGSVSGDGWLAARGRNGRWEIIQVDFISGAPCYPRYSLNEDDYSSYIAAFGGKYEVRMWHDWEPGTPLGSPIIRSCEMDEIGSAGVIPDHEDEFFWPVAEFDLLLAFSDGLGTFGKQVVTSTSRDTVPVPVGDVLTSIVTSIKGTRGTFLSRNLYGPVGAFKTFAREGWEHHDDLSICGVYCSGVEQ